MRPVHAFEDDLPFVWAIEDDGDAVLVPPRLDEHATRRRARQQMAQHGLAGLVLYERAVVAHQRQRDRHEPRDRHREMKAPASHERNRHSAAVGCDHRIAMRVRQASPAVEERSVYIDGEKADHR